MSKNILRDKSFAFAIRIVKLYKYLTEQKNEYIMIQQILKTDTSIGANVREGQNGESTKDFIHKYSIAQKGCDETLYWLELFHKTDYISERSFNSMSQDATELLKMLKSSILTSKNKLTINSS